MTADARASPSRQQGRAVGAALHTHYTGREKLPIAVDPNAHVCLRGFEIAVLAELPYLGCNSTLGCELQFVQTDTYHPYRVN